MKAVGAPSLLPPGLDLRVLRKVGPQWSYERLWAWLQMRATWALPQTTSIGISSVKLGMRWIRFQVSPAGWLLTSFLHEQMNTDIDAWGNREEGGISAHSNWQCYREKEEKNMDLILKWDCKPEPWWILCLYYLISSNLPLSSIGRHQIWGYSGSGIVM